jgi:hypothetical protein
MRRIARIELPRSVTPLIDLHPSSRGYGGAGAMPPYRLKPMSATNNRLVLGGRLPRPMIRFFPQPTAKARR